MRKWWRNDWLYAAVILAAAFLLCHLLMQFGIGRESLLMVYMIGVQCCACVTHGYFCSTVCAAASMMLFNFLYTEPLYTFKIRDPNDVTLLMFFLLTAFLSAGLTARLRDALAQSRENAQRAERFYQEKEGALLEAERAHMKSSLLRSIGHDLRTPLTGIQCGSSYLADHAETLARGDIRRMAEDISNQSTWLITMVENILYMTRLDNDRLEADKQPEVVDDVVNEAVSHVPALRERDFSVSLPAQVSTVPMDGRMIVQVLVNLLDNAVKYTPQGCRIRLSAEAREGRMYFCVDDAGSGIAPELRKKIFDSFVTSGKIGPDGRKGIGLGLAICRAAVRAHGGEISAESAPLGGARFIFWLPAAEPDDTSKEDDPDGT